MAKKKNASKAGSSQSDTDDSKRMANLKTLGDRAFGRHDFQGAFKAYNDAVGLLPEGHADRAIYCSNKAACLMMMKRFKEAVTECTAALASQPGYTKALSRRARAYEQQGNYQEALKDVQGVNSTEAATPETRSQEQRLKDAISGKTLASKPDSASAAPRPRQNVALTAKATLGDDTRVFQFGASMSFAHLKEMLRAKFPEAGPFNVKSVDSEGDLVTLTSRQDLGMALNELVATAQRSLVGSHGPKLNASQMPSLRLQLLPCTQKEELSAPVSELADLQRMREQLEAQLQKQAAANAKNQAAASPSNAAGGEVVELDEWLVDFAHLFREVMGIDPDRHVDLHNEGWEKCTAALDVTVKSDKALPLFEQAADRFREVTATGLYNWGNVHMCVARKLCDEAVTAGKSAQEAATESEGKFCEAEQRYQEALGYKADLFDATLAMGQIAFERAKLHAGFLVAAPKQDQEGAAAELEQARETQQAAVAAALKQLKREDVVGSKSMFDTAHSFFEKALGDISPEAEAKLVEQKAKEKSEDPMTLAGQVRVMWGNILYEQSQLLAAVEEASWKSVLDQATDNFKEAGCKAVDIRNAVSNHTRKDELDLDVYGPAEPETPPEEAPKAAETPAAEASKPVEPKVEAAAATVKGLPALSKAAKKGRGKK